MVATLTATPKPARRAASASPRAFFTEKTSLLGDDSPRATPLSKSPLDAPSAGERKLPKTLREAVKERAKAWSATFKPGDAWEVWLVEAAALASLKIEACERSRAVRSCNRAERASRPEIWEADREEEVAEIMAKFAKDPVRMVAKLRRIAQGVRKLLSVWKELGAILDELGSWDEPARRLAFRLQGRAPELWSSDPMAQERTTLEQNRALVERQIGELNRLLESGLSRQNEMDRLGAIAGAAFDQTAEGEQLRRASGRLERNFQWFIRQLRIAGQDAAKVSRSVAVAPFPVIEHSLPKEDTEAPIAPVFEPPARPETSEPAPTGVSSVALSVDSGAEAERKARGFLSRAVRETKETTRSLPALGGSSKPIAASSDQASAKIPVLSRKEIERLRKEERAFRRRRQAKGIVSPA